MTKLTEESLVLILNEYVKPFIATDEDLLALNRAQREIKKLEIALDVKEKQLESLIHAYSVMKLDYNKLLSEKL